MIPIPTEVISFFYQIIKENSTTKKSMIENPGNPKLRLNPNRKTACVHRE
uniref:Uncharacterized protein n=1 Tax=Candidatus Kentrum sp. FW TaxID=2126338 RepID=A0A450T198_9GAMM|nr:MAG: hypothetical protein BECKFW1821A_GA0114235_106113 [Candidatus Kentron sp. FW]VFJ60200.1 MAG: hypothetical protein BECKFW1821B_GA0114236_105411 [Candidatus Kentron sp. FW]